MTKSKNAKAEDSERSIKRLKLRNGYLQRRLEAELATNDRLLAKIGHLERTLADERNAQVEFMRRRSWGNGAVR